MPCTLSSTTGSSTFFYKAKGQLMRNLQTVQQELQELQELLKRKGEKIIKTNRPVQYFLLSLLFLLLKTRSKHLKKGLQFTSQKQERGGREDLIYTTKYWTKQSQ